MSMGEGTSSYTASNMAENLSVIMSESLVDIVIKGLPEAECHKHELLNVLIDLTSSAMRDLRIRFNMYAERCVNFIKQGDFQKNIVTFQTSVQCVERLLMHHYRQRANYFTIGSGNNEDTDVAENSKFSPNAHRFALKKCRSQIVSELNIEGTTLMDDLIGADLMTEPERESVIGKHTSKAKTEDLFRLIHGRVTLEQMKNIFLPAVAKDHPWLAKHLLETMKFASDADNVQTCVCCRMRDEVEVKRIADYLLQQDVVSDTQHADLTSPWLPNSIKWKEVLSSPKSDLSVVVISALENTYPSLFDDFQFRDKRSLDCFCHELMSEDVGSSTDSSVDIDIGRMSDVMSISTPSITRKPKVHGMATVLSMVVSLLCILQQMVLSDGQIPRLFGSAPEAVAGDTFTFNCRAYYGRTVEWSIQFAGNIVDTFQVRELSDGTCSAAYRYRSLYNFTCSLSSQLFTLTILYVDYKTHHQTNWTCTDVSARFRSNTVLLEVNATLHRVEITNSTKNPLAVTDGDGISVECKTNPTLLPSTILWSKDGESGTQSVTTYTDDDVTVSTLTFTVICDDHLKGVWCTGVNGRQRVTSPQLQLFVHCRAGPGFGAGVGTGLAVCLGLVVVAAGVVLVLVYIRRRHGKNEDLSSWFKCWFTNRKKNVNLHSGGDNVVPTPETDTPTVETVYEGIDSSTRQVSIRETYEELGFHDKTKQTPVS